MSKWKSVRLDEILTLQRGHDLTYSQMQKGNIPVIGSTGIIGFHNVKTTNAPCVTIGRSGNIGKAFFFNHDCWAHNTVLYVNDFKDTYPKYAYYLLKSLDFSQYNVGSAVPTLNRNHIYPITIMLPPPLEQKSIAEVLTSLDDKIDNLTKQNQTLESMIQTLFKSWFINFDPVVAKAECKSKNGSNSQKDLNRISKELGISKDILNLFPNTFEKIPNEFEEIPKGWTVSKLSSLVNIYGGKQLDRIHFSENGKYLVFGGAGIMGRCNVFNEDGFTISFGRVGVYCGQFFWHDGKSWINNNASVVKPNDSRYIRWIYYFLSNFPIDLLKKGAAQPFVSNQDLLDIDLILPNLQLILKFDEITSDLFFKIKNNNEQIYNLKKNKDYLLPKLMSGKVTIKGKTK